MYGRERKSGRQVHKKTEDWTIPPRYPRWLIDSDIRRTLTLGSLPPRGRKDHGGHGGALRVRRLACDNGVEVI